MAIIESSGKEQSLEELAAQVRDRATKTLDEIEAFIGTIRPETKANSNVPTPRSPDPIAQIREYLVNTELILKEISSNFNLWARHIRA